MKQILLLPLILLAGCGGGGASGEEDKAVEPVAQVQTAIARIGSASEPVTLYGVVEAGPGGVHSLIVPADAIIGSISAPTGTAVRRGQTIVIVRPSPTTRVDAAKSAAEAVATQSAYQRALRLRADGLVSDADVEAARATATAAQAARVNLWIPAGALALRAPFAGTVQNLTARPGDQLTAGAVVATVAAPGDLRARFGVDPALAQNIHAGQTITIDSVGGNAPATVGIIGVDTQVDPTTRLVSVFVRIPAGIRLSVGQPLRATLSVGTASGLVIPYSALLDDGGRSYVFVVKGGIANAKDVLPGNSSGDHIQILNGLQPGDTVVTEGGTALEDGMKVSQQNSGPKK